MRRRVRNRIAAVLRWLFFMPGKRGLVWRELAPGIAILVSVAALNTTCQAHGLYERFEWADLDRLQRTAPPTGAGGVSLVLIDDEEYEQLFAAISPLEPATLSTLIASICAFAPRVIGIDILTSDWPADAHQRLAAAQFGGCPIVWISDVIGFTQLPPGRDAYSPPRLRLGKVLGNASPPPGVCAAASILEPDNDGVIRRYSLWYPAHALDQPSAGPARYPTLVAALAGYARTSACDVAGPLPAGAAPDPRKIRFTSNESFPRFPAHYVLEAARDTGGPLRQSVRSLLENRIVILGGAYRHARDRHRTPVGFIHGSELIANAVHTELSAPIADVRWWQALAVDIVVGMFLLIGLSWARLHWPWASLASLLLSAFAALVIAWQLHRYLGYFLGVLGGLMGVVLAIFAGVLWKPLRQMWRSWLNEFPHDSGHVTDNAPAAINDVSAAPELEHMTDDAVPTGTVGKTLEDPVGRAKP